MKESRIKNIKNFSTYGKFDVSNSLDAEKSISRISNFLLSTRTSLNLKRLPKLASNNETKKKKKVKIRLQNKPINFCDSNYNKSKPKIKIKQNRTNYLKLLSRSKRNSSLQISKIMKVGSSSQKKLFFQTSLVPLKSRSQEDLTKNLKNETEDIFKKSAYIEKMLGNFRVQKDPSLEKLKKVPLQKSNSEKEYLMWAPKINTKVNRFSEFGKYRTTSNVLHFWDNINHLNDSVFYRQGSEIYNMYSGIRKFYDLTTDDPKKKENVSTLKEFENNDLVIRRELYKINLSKKKYDQHFLNT